MSFQQIAHQHFEPPVEFLDLFLPINLSSESRAKAFLWLIFHYLSEPDALNPFDDTWSRGNTGKVPRMLSLSREDMQRENQDPSEEIEWGQTHERSAEQVSQRAGRRDGSRQQAQEECRRRRSGFAILHWIFWYARFFL